MGTKWITLGVKYSETDFEQVEKCMSAKGFDSINSYLKYLVNEDLKKIDSPATIESDEKRVLIEGLISRLSEEQLDKVIDYVKLLLK